MERRRAPSCYEGTTEAGCAARAHEPRAARLGHNGQCPAASGSLAPCPLWGPSCDPPSRLRSECLTQGPGSYLLIYTGINIKRGFKDWIPAVVKPQTCPFSEVSARVFKKETDARKTC